MTISLTIDKDAGAVATYVIPFSDETKTILLTANIDATIAVPSDANLAIFYYDTGKDIFVRADAAIVRPVDSTPVSTAGVLLKPSVNVQSVSILHFICGESAFVCVEFYR